MESFKAIFLFIAYIFSLFITGILTAMTLAGPVTGKELNLISLVTTGLFACMTFYLRHQATGAKYDMIERKAFNMVISNDGFVTAFEIAAKYSLKLKHVRMYLEKCSTSGMCEKRYIEGSSVEVFYFKDWISLDLKKSSKPKSDIKT